MNEAVHDTSGPSIDAATAIIFRQTDGCLPEILMAKRGENMRFAAGAAVFPGGRVDKADHRMAQNFADNAERLAEIAHRIAAMRETLEETGLVIGMRDAVSAEAAQEARGALLAGRAFDEVMAELGFEIDLDLLVPYARWHPKNEKLSRVFDTRFYITNLGSGRVDLEVDGTENSALFWCSAQDALRRAHTGDLKVIFPTRRNLERLAQYRDYNDALQDCARHPIVTITPFLTEENGERWLRIPDNAGYPVTGEPLSDAMRG